MAVTAKLNNLKITARKVRMVADLIRRKPATEAEAILRFTTRKASQPLLKLLRSAIANAKNNAKLDPADLVISKLLVNDGPTQERVYPRSRGRADRIQKKTSHITLELSPMIKQSAGTQIDKKADIKKTKE